MNAREEAFGTIDPYVPLETRLSQAGYVPSSSCQMDRPLAVHEGFLGFSTAELPTDSRLLLIGSGATRMCERQLNVARPDIMTVSVDPLLCFGVQERHLESVRQGGRRAGSALFVKTDEIPGTIMNGEAYFRKAAICGGFMLRTRIRPEEQDDPFNYLPFKNDVFDTVLALHSLPQYIPANEIPVMFTEVVRVTRPGGFVSMYPILEPDTSIIDSLTRSSEKIGDVFHGDPKYVWFHSPLPGEANRLSFTKAHEAKDSH